MNYVNDDGDKGSHLEKGQTPPVRLINEDDDVIDCGNSGELGPESAAEESEKSSSLDSLLYKAIVDEAGTDVLMLYSEKTWAVTAKKARKRYQLPNLLHA